MTKKVIEDPAKEIEAAQLKARGAENNPEKRAEPKAEEKKEEKKTSRLEEAFEDKFSQYIKKMTWVNFGGGHHITKDDYNREKLIKSFLKACEKRHISTEQIEEEVSKIEAKLKSFEETEIPSKYIGELVMKALKRLDKVAYIRFASVYRDFTDLSDYEEELKKLVNVETKKEARQSL